MVLTPVALVVYFVVHPDQFQTTVDWVSTTVTWLMRAV